MNREQLRERGIYKHKRTGTSYRVIHLGQMRTTNDIWLDAVIYQRLDDTAVWVRPAHNFMQSFEVVE